MLNDVFYTLGIIYFSFMLILLVAIIAIVFVAYRKVQQLKEKMPTQFLAVVAATRFLGMLPLKRFAPLMAAIPLILNLVGGKKNKRRLT